MTNFNNHQASYLTLLFLLSFFIQNGFSQDTIEVQTFTFESETRNGVFDFPDDPNQTYEKILMLYTMRCHDNAVGSGNIGCREWDYSCNTFITDSSRVDSTQQIHPNFVISNFSESTFPYTTQPSYTYYQYEQQEVVYNNTLSEQVAFVDAGSENISLGGSTLIAKNQYLYTANELTTAGLSPGALTGLQLDLSDFGDELSFLRVRIKHSSKSVLDENDPDLDGFTPVYFLNTLWEGSNTPRLNFFEDFIWDGTSNIILELSYNNVAAGEPITIKGQNVGFAATLVSNQKEHHLKLNANGGVDIPTNSFANINQEITISLWAYGDPDALPTNTTVFEGIDEENNRQANVHLPWSNGQIYWDCGNDGTGYDRINTTADPSDFAGKWSHWAFTKNATTGEMKIFLNGVLWHSGTQKNKAIDITQFSLGQAVTFNNGYLGQVDELRIWNKALEAGTIQNWMNRSIDDSHPEYASLVAYYPLNEGNGNAVMDQSIHAETATFTGVPAWVKTPAIGLNRNFKSSTIRPNLGFVQGLYDASTNVLTVLDSVLNAQHLVLAYGLNGTDLIGVDTFFAYPSGDMSVFNENGTIVSTINVPSENTLEVVDLIYYQKNPAKYEILSLVTPYGNGLTLGPEGKTFIFDLTDYSPILKGKKRLSIELGGQFQEELDLKFQFIKGTPPRNVLDIQNIWPFRRGWYADILNNRYFEPRQVMMHPNGVSFKIRSTITGHGQNGEFISRSHFIDLDGGVNEFNYNVWKECATIPIYPQGGTWLFDRAGWCPGHPSDVHQFDITPYVTPGESTEIDYGLNGNQLAEANYLVSNQLVSYGPPNRMLDVAVHEIKRPSKRVEFQRINPACNLPIVVIENTGMTPLTQVTIEYGIANGTTLTYEWTGNLAFLETEEVTLPVDDLSFWNNAADGGIFEVNLIAPNGMVDEYLANNQSRSSFNPVMVFDGSVILNYTTNSRGYENVMQITDHTGEVVLFRDNMANNTNYNDELDLAPGCYTLNFFDAGDDGLYYWYWAAIGQNIGAGQLRFRKELAPGIFTNLRTFHPEFGRSIQFDFVLMDETTSTDEEELLQSYLSIYPNPTLDEINIEVRGAKENELSLELIDVTGRVLLRDQILRTNNEQVFKKVDLSAFADGVYFLRMMDGEQVMMRQVVKQ